MSYTPVQIMCDFIPNKNTRKNKNMISWGWSIGAGIDSIDIVGQSSGAMMAMEGNPHFAHCLSLAEGRWQVRVRLLLSQARFCPQNTGSLFCKGLPILHVVSRRTSFCSVGLQPWQRRGAIYDISGICDINDHPPISPHQENEVWPPTQLPYKPM